MGVNELVVISVSAAGRVGDDGSGAAGKSSGGYASNYTKILNYSSSQPSLHGDNRIGMRPTSSKMLRRTNSQLLQVGGRGGADLLGGVGGYGGRSSDIQGQEPTVLEARKTQLFHARAYARELDKNNQQRLQEKKAQRRYEAKKRREEKEKALAAEKIQVE